MGGVKLPVFEMLLIFILYVPKILNWETNQKSHNVDQNQDDKCSKLQFHSAKIHVLVRNRIWIQGTCQRKKKGID